MSKIFNEKGYVENGQFAGGLAVTGSDPIGSLPFTAGGLYIGLYTPLRCASRSKCLKLR